MDNQRLILFVVLGFLFLMLWQSWVEYSSPQLAVETISEKASSEIVESGNIPETPALSSDTPGLSQDSAIQSVTQGSTGEAVFVETDNLKLELNTVGAGINKVWLKKYTVDIDHPDEFFQLMNDSG